MNDLILHHYPSSPFSEKIRLVLGYKKLPWKSVLIPNIMPKPDLMPLTGGYRKTPVLQVGADIYCDTQLIMLEIERLGGTVTRRTWLYSWAWRLAVAGGLGFAILVALATIH